MPSPSPRYPRGKSLPPTPSPRYPRRIPTPNTSSYLPSPFPRHPRGARRWDLCTRGAGEPEGGVSGVPGCGGHGIQEVGSLGYQGSGGRAVEPGGEIFGVPRGEGSGARRWGLWCTWLTKGGGQWSQEVGSLGYREGRAVEPKVGSLGNLGRGNN